MGIKLIISGLPCDSLNAAQNHLQRILQELGGKYNNFPKLDVVSPATADPLDCVWISLADPYKEVPRPDLLDKLRVVLDGIDGLCARWKMSASHMDKTRQVYFLAEEGVNLVTLNSKLDRILTARNLLVQSSWVPKDGCRIFYLFLARDAFSQLMNQPLEVDQRFYHHRRSSIFNPRPDWK